MSIGAFGGRPRRQIGGGGVFTAGQGRRQRRAWAFEELERDVFERQLGVFGEGRCQLPRLGVWFDLPCKLGDDPGFFVFHRQVDRQQRTERVLVGLSEIDRPWQLVSKQRRAHFERPDLRGIRTALRRFGEPDLPFGRLISDLRLITTTQTVSGGGVHRHALGQRDPRVLQRSGAAVFQVFVLGLVEVEPKTGRAVRETGGRLRGDGGFELQLVAAFELDRVTGFILDIDRAADRFRRLPRRRGETSRERLTALARHPQQRHPRTPPQTFLPLKFTRVCAFPPPVDVARVTGIAPQFSCKTTGRAKRRDITRAGAEDEIPGGVDVSKQMNVDAKTRRVETKLRRHTRRRNQVIERRRDRLDGGFEEAQCRIHDTYRGTGRTGADFPFWTALRRLELCLGASFRCRLWVDHHAMRQRNSGFLQVSRGSRTAPLGVHEAQFEAGVELVRMPSSLREARAGRIGDGGIVTREFKPGRRIGDLRGERHARRRRPTPRHARDIHRRIFNPRTRQDRKKYHDRVPRQQDTVASAYGLRDGFARPTNFFGWIVEEVEFRDVSLSIFAWIDVDPGGQVVGDRDR